MPTIDQGKALHRMGRIAEAEAVYRSVLARDPRQFDALGRVPVMVIRGANSDILSAATVEAMRKRRSALDVVDVPDEGHAPRLAGSLTIGRITAFIASCDATGSGYRS